MDGGRRILRSLREASRALAFGALPQVRPAYAGGPASDYAAGSAYGAPRSDLTPALRNRRARRRSLGSRLFAFVRTPGVGIALAITLVAASGLAGAIMGGQYQAFAAEHGQARDILARLLGFRIDAITITGDKELAPTEILQAGGITPRNSLLFLDVDAVRAGLMKLPLVQEVSVRKLYPDQMIISLTERQPFGLWQRDGNVQIVAQDGMAIDSLHGDRFLTLPFVVGDNANKHVADYLRLLDASGDLRSKIRAGIWVGDRRWDLKLTSGLEVRLPEVGAESAVRELVRLAHDDHILDKDLISIDLRIPGRLVARLSEDAAAARRKVLAHTKGRGGA